MGQSGYEAFVLDAGLDGCVSAEGVEGGPAQRGHVLDAAPGAQAGGVLVEGHIQAPVDLVLDAPVGADDLGQAVGQRVLML
ncbi:MAG: hypothetical protein K2Q09_10695 [Phycisphaerales bacterium]|nr:hypothetical protein [Chloroflexota bacterium]MBY0309199.1 hypothetical protein [Phycisphaerales bacterium]